MEHCSPGARNWFATLIFLPWCFSYAGLAMIAYWTRDWRQLQLIASVLYLISALLFFALPESPRYLLSQRRFSEAEGVIKRAAKFNGVKLPEDFHLDPLETP